MTIRTNPPGAMVYVDDYPIGTTPISHNFIYYGTRKIRLVLDGYRTETFFQPMRPPWYQIPPLDFVSENLVPGELTDRRDLAYNLVPQRMVPVGELRQQAEALRSRAHASGGGSAVPSALGTAPGPEASTLQQSGGRALHVLPPAGDGLAPTRRSDTGIP